MTEDPRVSRLRAVEDFIEVCLDSAPENMVSDLALRANAVLDSTWNGWSRPVATAGALQSFLARWARSDPNGTWGRAVPTESELVYISSDSDDEDHFPRVDKTSAGETLYDLTGWMWVRI